MAVTELKPMFVSLKTTEGFVTIKADIIREINWNIPINDEFVIRVFMEDDFYFDVDYMDRDNQRFFFELLGYLWKTFLHPSHKAKLNINDDNDEIGF